jgi:hypothetical protein
MSFTADDRDRPGRIPLFDRLPEVYRIRDAEQDPPDQLKAYIGLLDRLFSTLHADAWQLHRDLFIDTCRDWVIPYIADLLGTSHLSGDPWTLRADVARTVKHRRRKGTLGALESLAHALSGWAVHAAETWPRLLWNQHLNHQRPDAGGQPPHAMPVSSISMPARGGTVNLRDPASLSLLNGPFDPFGHAIDLKPGGFPNLPTLALFLWRLKVFAAPFAPPVSHPLVDLGGGFRACRFDLHSLGRPMRLFNTHRHRTDDEPPILSSLDRVPGPMPAARLTQDSPSGRPEEYIRIEEYATASSRQFGGEAGLILHTPSPAFAGIDWRFRGANLCAWEAGLHPPLRENEVVVDPDRGRLVIGVLGEAARAIPLRDGLRVSAGYGFSGPVGAHAIPRPASPQTWLKETVDRILVDGNDPATPTLAAALASLQARTRPLLVEIRDSLVHDLDLSAVVGIGDEGGASTLLLGSSLWIRAGTGQRPVVRLIRPLRFRPADVLGPDAPEIMGRLTVKLEGIHFDRGPGFPAASTLVEQAALNRLELDGCTLDPHGHALLDGTRAPILSSCSLANDYGFVNPLEETAFDQTPEIVLHRCITGPLFLDDGYTLRLQDSILDAGTGPGDSPQALALGAASGDPLTAFGPDLDVSGLTCFGRMRVETATGEGGIWTGRLQAQDDQKGCLKHGWFGRTGNRLPPNHACLFAAEAEVDFVSVRHGDPGYAQLSRRTSPAVREQGPLGEEMGAFGFLRNTSRRKNIGIRCREFMPAGIQPLWIEVT